MESQQDRAIVDHISELVAEEHELRNHAKAGVGLDEAQQKRVEEIEVQLDQCWDLLRRRQGREEFGQDPSLEHEQPPSVVERYRQ